MVVPVELNALFNARATELFAQSVDIDMKAAIATTFALDPDEVVGQLAKVSRSASAPATVYACPATAAGAVLCRSKAMIQYYGGPNIACVKHIQHRFGASVQRLAAQGQEQLESSALWHSVRDWGFQTELLVSSLLVASAVRLQSLSRPNVEVQFYDHFYMPSRVVATNGTTIVAATVEQEILTELTPAQEYRFSSDLLRSFLPSEERIFSMPAHRNELVAYLFSMRELMDCLLRTVFLNTNYQACTLESVLNNSFVGEFDT